MKTLKLKKEAIVSLSIAEQLELKGGWTTSHGGCTQTVKTEIHLCCGETDTAMKTTMRKCDQEEEPSPM